MILDFFVAEAGANCGAKRVILGQLFPRSETLKSRNQKIIALLGMSAVKGGWYAINYGLDAYYFCLVDIQDKSVADLYIKLLILIQPQLYHCGKSTSQLRC